MSNKNCSLQATSLRDAELEISRLGESLEDSMARERFVGVQRDILHEVKSGLCTAEQAIVYAQNFVTWLGEEQMVRSQNLVAA